MGCQKLGEQAIAPLAQLLPTLLNDPQYFQCNLKKSGPHHAAGLF